VRAVLEQAIQTRRLSNANNCDVLGNCTPSLATLALCQPGRRDPTRKLETLSRLAASSNQRPRRGASWLLGRLFGRRWPPEGGETERERERAAICTPSSPRPWPPSPVANTQFEINPLQHTTRHDTCSPAPLNAVGQSVQARAVAVLEKHHGVLNPQPGIDMDGKFWSPSQQSLLANWTS
jgi:hypothetical protein